MASNPSPKVTHLLELLAWSNSLDINATERTARRRLYEAELKKLQLEVAEAKALRDLWLIKKSVPLKIYGDVQDCIDDSRILVEMQRTRNKWLRKVFLFG